VQRYWLITLPLGKEMSPRRLDAEP